ncbi:ABC transporter substrate-binding protein [Paenibacillus chartarius]|uniref:ABC transporter substrate-binding protein n=1 Tax=Paenibacillus chartarius TaxID=747481 RepID=A0ABV6DF11_9BACL
MTMRSSWLYYVLACIVLIAAVMQVFSGKQNALANGYGTAQASASDAYKEAGTGTLAIWTIGGSLQYEVDTFQKSHPHVHIEVKNWDNELRLKELYLNALAEGTAPDIMMIPYPMLGAFSSSDKLADLTASPMNVPDMRQRMGEYLWNAHLSLDGKRLVALPFEAFPQVLYYRQDILKDAGFPYTPDNLASFLKEPANWNQLSKTLAERKIWLTQFDNDLIYMAHIGQFMYNRNLDYERSSDIFKKAYAASLMSKMNTANVSIWTSNGLELLKQGKLAMAIFPAWGEDVLSGWLPEQAGLWSAAPLPFGATGISQESSKSIAITAQSKNKAVAAEFLQYVFNESGTLRWYKDRQPSEFLGGQNAGELYLRLILDQPVQSVPTPLDDKAFQVWKSSIELSLSKNISPDEALKSVEADLTDVLSVSQQKLKHYLHKNAAP